MWYIDVHVELYICGRCFENQISVLCLPAHTTHLLQVSDISIFGPLKTYLTAAFEKHRESFPYALLHNSDMASIISPAWIRATSTHNVVAGFEKSGIWPFDNKKVTAAVYKEGVRRQDLHDNSLKAPPLPVLTSLPSPPQVTSTTTSTVTPLPLDVIVDSILSVQVSTAKPKPRKRAPRKVESTFAVLLTHDEQRHKLHAAAQEKQQKQEKKDQNIRKKAEKRAETEKKKEEKKKEKRGNLSKRSVRLGNKENICPNIPTPDFDPYGN